MLLNEQTICEQKTSNFSYCSHFFVVVVECFNVRTLTIETSFLFFSETIIKTNILLLHFSWKSFYVDKKKLSIFKRNERNKNEQRLFLVSSVERIKVQRFQTRRASKLQTNLHVFKSFIESFLTSFSSSFICFLFSSSKWPSKIQQFQIDSTKKMKFLVS